MIGNSDYRSSPLKNPVNDARDLAQALGELGFAVTTKLNSSHKEMIERWKKKDWPRIKKSHEVGRLHHFYRRIRLPFDYERTQNLGAARQNTLYQTSLSLG